MSFGVYQIRTIAERLADSTSKFNAPGRNFKTPSDNLADALKASKEFSSVVVGGNLYVRSNVIVVELDANHGLSSSTKANTNTLKNLEKSFRRKIVIDVRTGNHYLRNRDGKYNMIRPNRRFEIALMENLGYEVFTVRFEDAARMIAPGVFCNRYAEMLAEGILERRSWCQP